MDRPFRARQTVELGGAFVHWMQPHVWADILRYGLAVEPSIEAECVSWISQGRLYEGSPDDIEGPLMAGFEWIGRDAREVVPLPFEPLATELAHTMDHLSIQDRLDEIEDPLVRDLQDGFWTSLASAPAREAGLVSTVLHVLPVGLAARADLGRRTVGSRSPGARVRWWGSCAQIFARPRCVRARRCAR